MCNNCFILTGMLQYKRSYSLYFFPLVSDDSELLSSESVTRYFFSLCFVMWKWHLRISFLVSVAFISH